jgi:hypothetical protein
VPCGRRRRRGKRQPRAGVWWWGPYRRGTGAWATRHGRAVPWRGAMSFRGSASAVYFSGRFCPPPPPPPPPAPAPGGGRGKKETPKSCPKGL